MKPARFDYERPRDVSGALSLLGETDVVSKVLAGGQSLGPMLNMRLVQPDLVVDITAVPEFTQADRSNGALVLGTCITHADIEDGRVPDVTNGAMQFVARGIAYRAVRTRGTIGGNLSTADPSADWVSALPALGAEVILRGPNGSRRIPVENYMQGALEPTLDAGELLEAVRIPALSRSALWGYAKVCRKTGEYAHSIGAVMLDAERGVFRAVLGATEGKPVVIAQAESLFGGRAEPDALRRVDEGGADARLVEAGMTDGLDRQIHVVALRRAAEAALA